MNNNDALTSICRHCRFYSPEGRRGGHCSQLNVAVQSTWKSCSLANRIFQPDWELSVWHSQTAFAPNRSAAQATAIPEGNSFTSSFTYVVESEPLLAEPEVSTSSL